MPCKLFHLTECFRSGPGIVDAANALIAHNAEPMAQPMIARGKGGAVLHRPGRSADIAEMCSHLRANNGYAYSDMAVLARTHRTLRRLDDVFRELKIPAYRVGRRFDICDTPELKNVLACLRLLVNPRDNLSFMRIAPLLGLSPAGVAELKAMGQHNENGALGAWDESGLDRVTPLADLFDEIERHELDDLLPFANAFCDAIGAPEYMRAIFPEYIPCSVADFLESFSHRGQPSGSQDDLPNGGDCVTLITVHASKGLEFPCVIVANLNEGELPSSQALKDPEGIRDERRLAYVAMTRAAECLVLHTRRAEDQAEGRKISEPSRFLQECGAL